MTTLAIGRTVRIVLSKRQTSVAAISGAIRYGSDFGCGTPDLRELGYLRTVDLFSRSSHTNGKNGRFSLGRDAGGLRSAGGRVTLID
jgi:hypothetical protein